MSDQQTPVESGAASDHSAPADVQQRKHYVVAGKMLVLAAAMFGFGYLMVPLYDIICEVTGLNGKTGRITVAESQLQLERSRTYKDGVAVEREITVEFVGIVSAGANWEFQPNERTMKVRPGEQYVTSYFAKNLSTVAVVGQASPSVSPFAAAKYFNKTECFCFTRQEFEAKGSRDMPVAFVVDPDIPINVDRITLSYTFFKSKDQTLSSVASTGPTTVAAASEDLAGS